MNDNDDHIPAPTEPNLDHIELGKLFEHLKEHLPAKLAEAKEKAGKSKGKIITSSGNQIIGEQHAQPNKFCKICTIACGSSGIVGDTEMKMIVCDKCQKEVDAGQMALTSPDLRVAWIRSSYFPKEAGNHIKVTNHEMDLVELRMRTGRPLGDKPVTPEPPQTETL